MFKKIVSQLSFSPALVGQLGFYAKRLRKEEATRRLGLIFVALALVVQSLVVFQAPEPANAANANDFIPGGLGTGSALSIKNFLTPYDKNERHLKDIMNFAGVTRAEIAAMKFSTVTAGESISYGFQNRANSTAVRITDSNGKVVTTIYGRNMTTWGYKKTDRIYAFVGTSKKLGKFAIIRACGNLVTYKILEERPEPKPANIKSSKKGINVTRGNVDATKVAARENDTIKYTVTVKNTGGTAAKVAIKDNLSDVMKYAKLSNNGGGTYYASSKTLSWGTVTVKPGATITHSYSVRMNSSLINTTTNCKMKNDFLDHTVTVPVNCTTKPANIVVSKSAVNTSQNNINATKSPARTNDKITYTVTVKNTGGTTKAVMLRDNLSDVVKYAKLTNNGGGTYTAASKTLSWGTVNVAPGATITHKYTVQMNASLISNTTSCKMTNTFLEHSVTVPVQCSTPPANIVASKSAVNVSQNNVSATKVTARENDTITYTVSVKNTGGTAKDVAMKDDLSDVLSLAKLTNNGGGKYNTATKELSWGTVSVKPGATVSHSYTVQINSTLINDTTDCSIVNSFMDKSLTVKVGCKTPPAEINVTKTASNISQGNIDATTVNAKENDRISFTLTAKNDGGTAKSFTFEDDISDALEYAKVIDNGGGTYDAKTQKLTWPEVTIAPGHQEIRTFTMQLLSSIPATPQGISDGSSYDCKIENTFLEAFVVIPVTCPGPKVIEQVVPELPHTGARENMLFAGIVLAIVVYFYLRSRQLTTEVRLIRRDVNGGTI